MQQQSDTSARARILDTSYDLFSTFGVQAIGIDRIVAEARVAKMTLYRYFPSKDDLIVAFLEERRRRWTEDWLQASIEGRAADPEARLLAAFDVFDEWFRHPAFEGCSFLRTLHEFTSERVHDACIHELGLVQQMLSDWARQAGRSDPDRLSFQIQTLMMGAIVSAMRGDVDAAARARDVATLLLQTTV